MSTKAAPRDNGPSAAGIYSDMTVDGPEIGTLVLVVDRAKNLPNRKSMGKQNPYCAARLGKEAKKTETDKRGGQTPKWSVMSTNYTDCKLFTDIEFTGIKRFDLLFTTHRIITTSKSRSSTKTSDQPTWLEKNGSI